MALTTDFMHVVDGEIVSDHELLIFYPIPRRLNVCAAES